ncbi:HAD-IIA family hydrolase [Intrasporangium sp. YIM S08009]|uniref:HAD-IIA family hydrolase n=1 Tax=Intrasporangium zincisolvens TaxID=3080018 RepID=UPI002B057DA8|nr:HAD-IIA family hydrolase [Intrasporangium sp. YIM S08009]
MTDRAFVDGYTGVVCDLDGVVYRGDDAVDGAPKALQDIVARGIAVVYATNNASRVPSDVADQLAGLGAPGGADDVVTSAQAGAERLASTLDPGSRVLALGGPGVAEALERAGLCPVTPQELGEAPDVPCTAVLQGFGRGLTVLDFERAARLLGSGIPWVATNDDATLPLPWGDAPGNGAYVDLLASAVGRRPDVVGKPHAPLYQLATARLGAEPSQVLAVGDRLDTDIAGARAAGTDSAWVLTGVGRPSDLLDTDLRPTVVVRCLSDLLAPLELPSRQQDGWSCGASRVRVRDDDFEVVEAGADSGDLLRAGLAALVERRDAGPAGARLAAAGSRLDRLAAGHPLA